MRQRTVKKAAKKVSPKKKAAIKKAIKKVTQQRLAKKK